MTATQAAPLREIMHRSGGAAHLSCGHAIPAPKGNGKRARCLQCLPQEDRMRRAFGDDVPARGAITVKTSIE